MSRHLLENPFKKTASSHPRLFSTAKDGFVHSLILSKDRILQTPIGRLTPQRWNEAELLLKTLRTNNLILHINDAFAILDRLNAEVNHHWNNRRTQQEQLHDTNLPRLPLHNLTLLAPLAAWRDAGKQKFISLPRRNQLSSELSSLHKNSSNRSGNRQQLSPEDVWQKVVQYMNSGLFDPHVKPVNMVLQVLVESLRHKVPGAGKLAIQLWDYLIQNSGGDPRNTNIHPNSKTVHYMIRILSADYPKMSPSSPHLQAEKYLELLKHWYQQTNMSCYQIWPPLYCAVMESHSRLQTPQSALVRIMQLFQEMKQALQHQCNRRDTNDPLVLDPGSCYNRTLHVLANLRGLPQNQNVHAARAILDEMCEAAIGSSPTNGVQGKENDNNLLFLRLKPDSVAFNAVLTAYGRAGLNREAQELFDTMEQLSERTGDPLLRPNLKMYSALIWAHAKAGDVSQAEATLARMIEEHGASWSDGEQLDRQVWGGLMASWAESEDPNAAKHIQLIMERLDRLAKEKNMPGLNTLDYNTLMSCYARQKDNPVDGALMVEQLLQWMERQNDDRVRPDSKSYFSVMAAWSNASSPLRCEFHLNQLCNKMIGQGQIQQHKPLLSVSHFNLAIRAWARHGNKDLKCNDGGSHRSPFERALALFERMNSLGIRPDQTTYHTLLNAARNVGTETKNYDAGAAVMLVFRKMQEQHRNGMDWSVKPDEITYSSVLAGLARSIHKEEAQQTAEDIFAQMQEEGIRPDAAIVNAFMLVFKNTNRPDRVEEIYQKYVLEQQEKSGHTHKMISADFFRTRLHAWSRVGNPERATMVLREWMLASSSSSTSMMTSSQSSHFLRVDEKPTTPDFTSVLAAWMRSGQTHAWLKAERGLIKMIRLAKEGAFQCRPNAISFTTVMTAYAKAPHLKNSGERASKLLNQLKGLEEQYPNDESLKPTVVTYNAVLSAWEKQGGAEAVEEQYHYLRKNHFGNRKYSALYLKRMLAWSGENNPEKTDLVLNEWIASTDENLDKRPAIRDFHIGLNAWAQSGEPRAGERAEKLLRKMLELAASGHPDCWPNATSFSLCILAYMRSDQLDSASHAARLCSDFIRTGDEDKDKKFQPEPTLDSYFEVIRSTIRSKTSGSGRNSNFEEELLSLEKILTERKERPVECEKIVDGFVGLLSYP